MTVNFNQPSVSFKSRYMIKGKDIDMQNPDHMVALGYAAASCKNMEEMFANLYHNEGLNRSNYVFDVNDKNDEEFESVLNMSGLKFNKLV